MSSILLNVILLSVSSSVMYDSFRPHELCSPSSLCPWNFSRQEYWRGLLRFLFQRIFPTQGWNRFSWTAGRFNLWVTSEAQFYLRWNWSQNLSFLGVKAKRDNFFDFHAKWKYLFLLDYKNLIFINHLTQILHYLVHILYCCLSSFRQMNISLFGNF